MSPADIIAALFVQASRPDCFEKAIEAAADAVIFDLEDAIADVHKDSARQNLRSVDAANAIVRSNGIGTAWHENDLALVRKLKPLGIICPKSEAGLRFSEFLKSVDVPVIALVEMAVGLSIARRLL
ncbi:aldolase/citrate lyase family protein [Mesorhizobium sp. M0047]|uniref:aldolase/citrate lyase family protein n=1 Tax=Mesorhizobium sp. M0047 TaxID=2956859 RepID=UPI003338200A